MVVKLFSLSFSMFYLIANNCGFRLICYNKDRGNITCYPHKLDDALWDATSMMDHPFRLVLRIVVN